MKRVFTDSDLDAGETKDKDAILLPAAAKPPQLRVPAESSAKISGVRGRPKSGSLSQSRSAPEMNYLTFSSERSPFSTTGQAQHPAHIFVMARPVNVLLDTFPGLSLPPTVCLPLSATTTTDELLDLISSLLPQDFPTSTRLILTTASSRHVIPSSSTTLADFVSEQDCSTSSCPSILSLRLFAPLCGGKGGFGSQLRAAGGRMSSRKRKQNAQLATGSARNLDGRRLRTITEAKNLAAYLATKPDMDRKEKDERRKRWEQVVELAEKREADMRAGKGPDGTRKGLSEEWMETKDEVNENVKNAVRLAMEAEEKRNTSIGAAESSGSGGSTTGSEDDSDENEDDAEDVMELDDEEVGRLKLEAEAGDADAIWVLKNKLKIPAHLLPSAKPQPRRFVGFEDEDDDEPSSSDDGEGASVSAVQSKGKAKIDRG